MTYHAIKPVPMTTLSGQICPHQAASEESDDVSLQSRCIRLDFSPVKHSSSRGDWSIAI
jgi:hypothetical protein